MVAVHLTVEGMPCPSCEVAIRAALKRLHGERSVSFSRDQAVVMYDPSFVTPGKVIDGVGAVGFQASSSPGRELTPNAGGSCPPGAQS